MASFSAFGLDGDVLDQQGFDEVVLDSPLQGRLARVLQEGGLGVDHQGHFLPSKASADVPWRQLHKLPFPVVQFSLHLALQQGSPFPGLLHPFPIAVADPQADVDEVSVALQGTSGDVKEFKVETKVAVLVKSVRDGFGEDQSVLVTVAAEESDSGRIRGNLTLFGGGFTLVEMLQWEGRPH
jgi:hypothetical protein